MPGNRLGKGKRRQNISTDLQSWIWVLAPRAEPPYGLLYHAAPRPGRLTRAAYREGAVSRRVYLLGVGLALVALGLAFTDWALSFQPGVTEMNVRRIRPGMTLAEVEAIFGGQSSQLIRFPPCGLAALEHDLPLMPWSAIWVSDSGTALVRFNGRDQVEETIFTPSEAGVSFPFSRLRAWLGW